MPPLPPRHLLSKSTFMNGCQCLRRLYLHKFKPEVQNPEDEQQQQVFATGTSVGELARKLFPGGVNAAPPDPYSYQQSVADTEKYIKSGNTVIYEAAFQYQKAMCAVDILVKNKNKWHAFEVKSHTSVKEQDIMDASYQYYIIKHSGLPIDDMSIVYLNNQYMRIGNLEIKKLFADESVLKQAQENKNFISEKTEELKKMLNAGTEPCIEMGKHCLKPYPCNFTEYCAKLKTPDTSEQSSVIKKYIDKDAIKEFLDEWEYPLCFFDFETINYAIPEFDYSRTYQQVPFQYSLFVKNNKNSKLVHYEFLGDGINDPRESLFKDLIGKLGNKGSIVTWNKPFEQTRLKEFARDFPVYAKKAELVINRLVDLGTPFRRKWFVHPDFEGSWSLKNILPVLVPQLSYENLEIKEGGTASNVYGELKNLTPEEQKIKREQLLEYCKLDTLAMVEIYGKMTGIL